MKVTIRNAIATDIDAIVSCNQMLASETEDKVLDERLLRSGVESAIQDKAKCHYFIAEVDKRVVGQTMVTFEWSDWRNGCFWWIQSVYVSKNFRRQGIFKQLYRHVVDTAKNSGACCGVRLYVEQDNLAAQTTYRQLGMKAPGYIVFEEDWSKLPDY